MLCFEEVQRTCVAPKDPDWDLYFRMVSNCLNRFGAISRCLSGCRNGQTASNGCNRFQMVWNGCDGKSSWMASTDFTHFRMIRFVLNGFEGLQCAYVWKFVSRSMHPWNIQRSFQDTFSTFPEYFWKTSVHCIMRFNRPMGADIFERLWIAPAGPESLEHLHKILNGFKYFRCFQMRSMLQRASIGFMGS